MKKRLIAYWIFTALTLLSFISGGLGDLLHASQVQEGMRALGYPDYVMTILGVWKLLGALAVAAPRLPRLKEWAYAGMVFDLTGAAASHAAVGEPVGKVVTPLVIAAVAIVSWWLRPDSRKLAGPSV